MPLDHRQETVAQLAFRYGGPAQVQFSRSQNLPLVDAVAIGGMRSMYACKEGTCLPDQIMNLYVFFSLCYTRK